MERLPLDRAIAVYGTETPPLAARAAASLHRLLAGGVSASPWRDVAWTFSRLTGDGYPVELAFASVGEAIRYTVEPCGAESDPRKRLERAIAIVTRQGSKHEAAGSEAGKEWADRLKRVQSAGPLDYGAWVGGRHDADGDAFKLYGEVPKPGSAAADEWAAAIVGRRPLLANRAPVLRMIGLAPADGRVEFYYRAHGLQSWEVCRLMELAGLADRTEELLALVGDAAEMSASARLPCAQTGFSLAAKATGGPLVFTLFCPARNAIGGDGRIRARLLGLAGRYGWPLRHYGAISEPLAGCEGPRTRHGLLSFAAAPGVPVRVGVGLRPP